jgi:hypothetical protein
MSRRLCTLIKAQEVVVETPITIADEYAIEIMEELIGLDDVEVEVDESPE